ncbi:DsbA family protein [Hyphomicrobium sp.]|uniref:DsbA family protein n=1 Tax=Hyphomicrobium sp. TaxID=82 RepID=UPI002FDE99AB
MHLSRPSTTRLAFFAGVAALGLAWTLNSSHAEDMPADRAGLDAYIRDYLMGNPQVLRDALLKLEADEQTENAKRVLRDLKEEIYHAGSPEIGNPDAKVIIVEFYDYNCPYCRSAYPEIKAFIEANPDTKIVLKDIASLGKESEAVARVVIAAAKQGKFAALHDRLMTQKGQNTEARALDAAAKLGLDMERLKIDAQSSETGDALTRAQQLADRLSVPATPLYIIGHQGISGSPDDLVAQLSRHVDDVRKAGCDVC